MSRMLAAKASLAIRVDALGDDVGTEMGIEHRATLEKRLRILEAEKVTCVLCTIFQYRYIPFDDGNSAQMIT